MALALEAAHLVPISGLGSSRVPNGLLVRADIHTLFDLKLIGVNSGRLTVAVAQALIGTTYQDLVGRLLGLPASNSEYPDCPGLSVGRKFFVESRG